MHWALFDCAHSPDTLYSKDYSIWGPRWVAQLAAVVMSAVTGGCWDYDQWGVR